MKIDIQKLEAMNPEDREVAMEGLEKLGYYIRYSTALTNFFEIAYDWQKDYFNSIGTNTVVGLIAGNRVGKSEAAAAYVACAATGHWPDWYTGYRFENKPLNIYVCGSTAQQLREAMQFKLFGTQDRNNEEEIGTGFVPRDSIVRFGKGRDGSMGSIWVKHVSGRNSRIEMLQYTQQDSAFQGSAVDLAVIDEEPGEKFFQQILKRIAVAPHSGKPGYVITAFTPEQQEEGFVMKQMWNLPTIHKFGDKIDSDTTYRYNVFENSKLKWRCINAGWPSVDHLDPLWQEQQLYGTAPYLHETIRWGKPMLGGGLIYPVDVATITYDPHEYEPLEFYDWLIACDFGFTRDDAAVVQMAYDKKKDIVYIVDCWKGKTDTHREFAQKIWQFDATTPVAWPRDGNKSGGFKGSATVAQKLTDVGVELLPEPFWNPLGQDGKRNAELEPGFIEIRSRLHTGRMKVNEQLVPLFDELENYRYDTNGKPKPRQQDHLMDAMRYGVMSIIQDLGEPLRDDGLRGWEDGLEDELHWNSY